MPFFVDVILPLPLNQRFTYALLDSQVSRLQPGMRVAVPFGKTKVYTAITAKIHQSPPRFYKAKYVEEILDHTPLLTAEQMQFLHWVSVYYMAAEGDVLRAALPGAFLLQSETVVALKKNEDVAPEELSDEEYLVYEALQSQALLKISEVMDLLNKKTVLPILTGLMEKGVITVNQEMVEKYKPKQVRYVRLAKAYDGEQLKYILQELERAPKQKEIILAYFALSGGEEEVPYAAVMEKAKASWSTFKAVLDKGILEAYYLQEDRITPAVEESDDRLALTAIQEQAYEQVKNVFKQRIPCLLHGVTSSGKTAIYIRLIKETIACGQQVLYLLPEIALTTQLIKRLQKCFGEEVMVYHSKYSINERVEVYQHVLHNDKGKIIVGVRSSIFLPFQKLGLIIVDEAHETTFKQFDPAPRYQARDAAVVLAQLFKSNILLGSATPSLESYYNALGGKYGLVLLKERYGKVFPPVIELVDIRDKYKRKRMTGHFSDTLLNAMSDTLQEKKQVILFQNRRGYSPVLECQTCGHSPQCPNCDVSLTYHKHNNSLRCHYCGYHMAMQEKCAVCGSVNLTTKGFGTEKIEKELEELFPQYKVGRMDLDTTRGKHGYEKIIMAFQQKKIDILVGTQMLAKGLDFRDVDLVGVMNADNLLNFPDFRAHERAFQLLVQVAGRAGRTHKQGKVLIQTYNPKHAVLLQVVQQQYLRMYQEQLHGRKQFKYPPFYRLIKISVKGRNYDTVNKAADWVAKGMKPAFKKNVLGPEFPPVARIRNEYYKIILLKIPHDQSLKKTKAFLQKLLKSYESIALFRSTRVILNVDPY